MDVLRRNLCCFTVFTTPFFTSDSSLSVELEVFSKITKFGPLSCHPTNQQSDLPRGSHRVKALAYSDLDATFSKCSREGLPKQSAQTSEASIDRGPSRRQPKWQTLAWRYQTCCTGLCVLGEASFGGVETLAAAEG